MNLTAPPGKQTELSRPSSLAPSFWTTPSDGLRFPVCSKPLEAMLREVQDVEVGLTREVDSRIHVFLCSWKRVNNLPLILKTLDDQTLANEISLHIINNNFETAHEIEGIVHRHQRSQRSRMRVVVVHNKENHSSLGRFIYMRALLGTLSFRYAIVVDDDQFFPTTWIRRLWMRREAQCAKSWYFKRFDAKAPKYWKVPFGYNTTATQNSSARRVGHGVVEEVSPIDYIGPGGSVIDTSVLLHPGFFDVPENAYHTDDLWLSYFFTEVFGGKLVGLPNMKPNTLGEATPGVAMHVTLFKVKQRTMEALIARGWRIGKAPPKPSAPEPFAELVPHHHRRRKTNAPERFEGRPAQRRHEKPALHRGKYQQAVLRLDPKIQRLFPQYTARLRDVPGKAIPASSPSR